MDIRTFLDKSYTAYHATQNGEYILEKSGFQKINLDEKWDLQIGEKYYVTKNDSALIAFAIGKNFVFNIAESHTDSPCLKVKGNTLIKTCQGLHVNVEEYGGLLHYSMFDRPLKIAGRIIENHGGTLVSKLVDSKYNVIIPSLAIHHNPTANTAFAPSVQHEMLPLLAEDAKDLYSTLTDENVVDADLYVVPSTQTFESGVNGEWLCSARIDNLTSVYASLCALANSNPQNIAIACCFDNEEVGSRTKQGANSQLLTTVLQKIARGLSKDDEDFVYACENGFIVSVDNAHATHPAHPEKADVQEKVYLNKGIVVKHHPNYATDGVSSAIFKAIAQKANLACQDYYNNSDLRCGSTIGLMTSANLAMRTVDIGIAQLAMHSALETVGKQDIDDMQKCLLSFFDCDIQSSGSTITIK